MIQDQLISEVAPELWKDNIWDRLLDSLDERSVIPIVGPDLLQVEVDGIMMPLDWYVARRLAQVNRLPEDRLPAEKPLNSVVCQLFGLRKDRYGICDDIFQIMKETAFQPPRAPPATGGDHRLQSLRVHDVRLAAGEGDQRSSVRRHTRDGVHRLLAQEGGRPAVRQGEAGQAHRLLPDGQALGHRQLRHLRRGPARVHLRPPVPGPASRSALRRAEEEPPLIPGSRLFGLADRIFLRTAKGGRLSATRDFVEILADSKTHRDPGLVSFLHHFSSHTRVFRAGGAVEFVDELWTRWRERHPRGQPGAEDQVGRDLPRNAIFISYARDDQAAVQELKAGLEAAGLPVWFDHESLKPGDSFNPQIEQYISRGCGCFVAVISENTERRHEGFFRREWNLALERDRGIHYERKFIVPVVVDDTVEPSAVPPRFAQLNYTWLPGGRVTPSLRDRELRAIINGS